ncbi:glycosyltransferase family 2 protein [Natronomonas sp. EA1]|uniref:glycosyltransferase family 2 protein n=1 Tax=Natronomonas sp. EA1 TaxID=3421655 RepID=UPI003EBAA499
MGVIATADNGNEVAGAVLRAQSHDHDVLVIATDPGVEGARFADQLGATVVVPEHTRQREDVLWQTLANEARDIGYPGLLTHGTLSRTIDYEASVAAATESTSYAVAPEFTAAVGSAPTVLAAIPAYNEAKTIADVVAEATPHADEVLVVDDGSSDATVEQALDAGATVIEHETNKGYGGALKTAFQEADLANAAHLVILDGDGQHDPSDIPDLVEQQRANDADIVIGSRFEEGSETELPLYRRFGLRVVNLLTNLSLGVVRRNSRIADTQSGFRAYNQQAIASLAADSGVGDHMGASTDILYHAHKQGYTVEEVGTTIDYEVENASSQHPLSHGLQLVNNILRTVERERPVTVLGVPGFLSAVVGLGFGYATFSNFLNSGVFPLGLALVSVFFTLAGIFAAFTAIILHSLETHSR